jgi:biotin carboxyl carrier protein
LIFYLEASKYACDDARLSIKDIIVAPITGKIISTAVKVVDKVDKDGVLPYIESKNGKP